MRRTRCGAGLAVAFILGFVTAAHAGVYSVAACGDAAAANNSWTFSTNAPTKLEGANSCGRSGSFAGLYSRDALDVSNAPAAATAEWSFQAPAATSITGVSYSRWFYKEDDNDWQPALRADGAVIDGCGIAYPAISCVVGAEGGQRVNRSFDGHVGALTVGVECEAMGITTCINGALGHHKVFAVLYGATVFVSDSTAPGVSNPDGPLLASGYISGNSSVSFDAADNTGIRTGRLYVDGSVHSSTTYTCDFTYAVPCSNKTGAELSLDTRSLNDGTHAVQVAAVDPAGNETRSATQSVSVDNNAPAAPVGLSIDGGSDWRGENSFSASWTNPSDSGSPVTAARYQLCASNGSACQPVQDVNAPDVSRIDRISVPQTGEWVLRLWLVDGAGNVDPVNSSAVTLRYGSPPTAPSAPQNEPAPPAPAPDSTEPATPLVDVTTSLTSPAPLTAAFRRDIGLRLTSARFSHGRLVIRGRLAAPGRIVLTGRTRSGRVFRKTAVINKRRFAIPLRLRPPRGRLTARFAGDATFRPATARLRLKH